MSELIGIVGVGQMGMGIAHVCALASHDVLIYDSAPGIAERAIVLIEGNLARQAARKMIPEDSATAALSRIKVVDDLSALGDCDIVIEAVTENEEAKIAVYSDLCPILKPEAVLATNTSSISVTLLGAATDRPERFIGIHFMNPVPMMELVELVRGIATDEDTYQYAHKFAVGLDKTTTNAEDFPAFIVNRRWHGRCHRYRHETGGPPPNGTIGAG